MPILFVSPIQFIVLCASLALGALEVRETMSNTVAVVEQSINTFKRSMTYIENGMQTTLDIAQDLVENETDISNSTFEELKNMMVEYVKLQDECQQFADSAQEVKDQFLATNSISVEDDLDRLLVELARPNSKVNFQNHPKYQEMLNKIRNYKCAVGGMDADDDDDDDVVMTQPSIIIIDPMTKIVMKDPVKSIVCGHSYERSTIEQYINSKKKAKCPFLGCVNSNGMKLSDLEDNKELKRYIERKNLV